MFACLSIFLSFFCISVSVYISSHYLSLYIQSLYVLYLKLVFRMFAMQYFDDCFTLTNNLIFLIYLKKKFSMYARNREWKQKIIMKEKR